MSGGVEVDTSGRDLSLVETMMVLLKAPYRRNLGHECVASCLGDHRPCSVCSVGRVVAGGEELLLVDCQQGSNTLDEVC